LQSLERVWKEHQAESTDCRIEACFWHSQIFTVCNFGFDVTMPRPNCVVS